MKSKFLKKNKFPNFPNVKFRCGARFTTNFGLDYLANSKHFRFHYATDRGRGKIYVPYDCKIEYLTNITNPSYKAFGTIIRMFVVGADFEIRVMHTNPSEINPDVKKLIKDNKVIKAGTYLGMAGQEGFSFGDHTHTEIVSLKSTSVDLDEALKIRNVNRDSDIDKEDFIEWASKYNVKKKITKDGKTSYRKMTYNDFVAYRNGRGMKQLNNYICYRRDYIDGIMKTWYDSATTLNM